jgi:hypothetical protein
MPLTPELEEMRQVACDHSASSQKLEEVYEYLTNDNHQAENNPYTRGINIPGRAAVRNILLTNPNTPVHVLVEFRQCGSISGHILSNPAFSLIVLKEPILLEKEILLDLVNHANVIHPNNISLLTDNIYCEIREEASLHISIAGEANENWRDEAGVFLAQGCLPSTERDLIGNTYRIPAWISTHFPEASAENDTKSLERLRVFCYALQYGSGWKTSPWYFHLGRLLSSRMYPSDYRTYSMVGNRFVRAAARELLENKCKKYR